MKQSKTYHNSTNQNKDFVKSEVKKFKSQEDQVLELMQGLKQATASEVWEFTEWLKTPLTSIRRALSNLSYEGKLTKSNKTKIGLYGRPEYYYTIKS